jgi:hypothetical protein
MMPWPDDMAREMSGALELAAVDEGLDKDDELGDKGLLEGETLADLLRGVLCCKNDA